MNIKTKYVVLSWCTWYLWANLVIELINKWYWVIWLYRNLDHLNKLQEYVHSKVIPWELDKFFLPFQIDINSDNINSYISGIFKLWIEIIWLINNAAIDNQDTLKEITLDKIEKIFRVNLFWHILLTREFMNYRESYGSNLLGWTIVNISSLLAQFWDSNSILYWASKAWMEWFWRNAAIELSWKGVNVFNVEINWLPNILISGNDSSLRTYDMKDLNKGDTIYFDPNKAPIKSDILDYERFTKPIVELLDPKWKYTTGITICIDWWVSIKR